MAESFQVAKVLQDYRGTVLRCWNGSYGKISSINVTLDQCPTTIYHLKINPMTSIGKCGLDLLRGHLITLNDAQEVTRPVETVGGPTLIILVEE